MALARQAHGVVLRSPHAHARILAIDTSAAAALSGVLAILTADELRADDIGDIPCGINIPNHDGTPSKTPGRPTLVSGQVRFVGDPVAFIVAETATAAEDAAEAVMVRYEELPAVVDPAAALESAAPQLHDAAPGNLCMDWQGGDREAVDRLFASAAKTVALEARNNRISPSAIEPRVAIGDYDAGNGQYTLHIPSQGVHRIRGLLAGNVLKVPESRLRVMTPDVGGGFGVKLWLYPEHVLVLWAAQRLGRPVKWLGSRAESFLTDRHGRDVLTKGEMALNQEGRILALRIDNIANLGAYTSYFAPYIPTAGGTRVLPGGYQVEAIHMRVRGAFTNSAPVDAYRGAGRPENLFLVQRMMDMAAREMGIDAAEMQRRNLVMADAMPYTNVLGQTYDSGDFHANLEAALKAADWAGCAARKDRARKKNRRRGIGLACYVDPCGGNRDQYAALRFSADGGVQLAIGAQSSGQGHETVFAQIVAGRLGLDVADVRVLQGDSDIVPSGQGSSGSRSIPIGGNAAALATARSIGRGRAIAAGILEADTADITFTDGAYEISGTDRRIAFAEVLKASFDPARVPVGHDLGLDSRAQPMLRDVTFPNGCHTAEVEVDVDTGQVRLMAYTAVDDFGRVINPMLVAGQVHGATTQGIGQALLENSLFDEASGQLLSGSFMDYALPRADDLPAFTLERHEVPCRSNELGVKGCGESGTTVSPAAIINAVVDALSEYGVHHLDMPATPEKVWQLIRAGKEA
ncbi:MAG: xanthine dehydrogenase family protein molybdopterin-binding subunit [Rhodospirillaceae bacterium]|nr:xanthine dehydrogenase family protein molybdopterin-binding subunit [Rhodospirillaceae bacterium]